MKSFLLPYLQVNKNILKDAYILQNADINKQGDQFYIQLTELLKLAVTKYYHALWFLESTTYCSLVEPVSDPLAIWSHFNRDR